MREEVCIALVGLLLGALMASPFMVMWAKQKGGRRRRRPPS